MLVAMVPWVGSAYNWIVLWRCSLRIRSWVLAYMFAIAFTLGAVVIAVAFACVTLWEVQCRNSADVIVSDAGRGRGGGCAL